MTKQESGEIVGYLQIVGTRPLRRISDNHRAKGVTFSRIMAVTMVFPCIRQERELALRNF